MAALLLVLWYCSRVCFRASAQGLGCHYQKCHYQKGKSSVRARLEPPAVGSAIFTICCLRHRLNFAFATTTPERPTLHAMQPHPGETNHHITRFSLRTSPTLEPLWSCSHLTNRAHAPASFARHCPKSFDLLRVCACVPQEDEVRVYAVQVRRQSH